MDETLSALIKKADEFLARDMLYISSGFAFFVSLGATFGLVSLDQLRVLGEINGLLLAVAVVGAFFFCYAAAFSIREIFCALRITTSATIFNVKHAPKDAKWLYPILRQGQPFVVADEYKERLSLTSVVHELEEEFSGYGSAKAIRRSIYLKEMCATTGALGLISASIGFLGAVFAGTWGVSFACAILICLSVFLCRMAFYQSMRGAALASDWRNAFLEAKVNKVP